ncbi:MAG: Dabb family protein [Candidatus Margulisiibacteriota bacterium]
MIKHLVFWRLKPEALGKSKAENLQEIKTRLEELADKITGMIRIEVGINFDTSERAADAALYSVFESQEALNDYQNYPDHVAIKDFIGQVVTEARVVDYEVS